MSQKNYKPLMHEPLRFGLTEPLQKALEKLGVSVGVEEIYRALVEPPNADMGHLAFGCFIFAKRLKKSPAVMATELISALAVIDGVALIEAAGPYVNFKFNSDTLAQATVKKALTSEMFKVQLVVDAPKTMIEYSQPNTHKELHVGHMRNLCLGDALVRLLRRSFGTDKIVSSTFPGDVGTHVAKCLWYIKNHIGLDVLAQKSSDALRGEWLGQMYSAANLKLEDDKAESLLLQQPELYEKNKSQLTEVLKQLEAGAGEYFDLWKETREWSIELMNKIYKWAGVEFDRRYWESEVDADSVKTIKKYFTDGKLVQSQGAIGLDLSAEDLGFCLLLKSDGTGLYATKDVELARRKFEEFKIEKSIYVVDMRQALHFKQVFKTLEHLGFEQAKNCYHLQYNFVELPDGAMSSRKGNIVPLTLLVEKMKTHVKTQYFLPIRLRYNDDYGMVRPWSNRKYPQKN